MATKKRRPTDWKKRPGGYVLLWEEWLKSPAYAELNCVARALLIEFYRVFRPERNGELCISVKLAAERLGVSKNTAAKAFLALESHGFIVLVRAGVWQANVAREWRLSTEKYLGHQPTDDWRKWTPPENSRTQKLTGPVSKSESRRAKQVKERPISSVLLDAATK